MRSLCLCGLLRPNRDMLQLEPMLTFEYACKFEDDGFLAV